MNCNSTRIPEQLRERLFGENRLRRYYDDGAEKSKWFICPAELRLAITEHDIHACISSIPLLKHESHEHDIPRYASLIWETTLTIFAILLFDDHQEHILKFLFRRDTDEKLTFSKDYLYYLPSLEREHFFERQWSFFPVEFTVSQLQHRDLSPKAVLPFLSETELGSGGFGTVWKVKLYPGCQSLVPDKREKEVYVARKELKERCQGIGERGVLSLLKNLRHAHIVEFLGSYTQNNVCNLLFPAAAVDLEKFLRQSRRGDMERYEIFSNVFGLTEALSYIHDFSFRDTSLELRRIGYHHDLRPANILVYGRHFVIADFGLSKLKSDSQSSNTALRGGDDDYLGPEHFDYNEWSNGSVGRPLDVWALGCIVAEIVTFVVGEAVDTFRDKRLATQNGRYPVSNHAFHLNTEVRPAVTAWLDYIITTYRDAEITQLIAIIRRMLHPTPKKRPKASQIAQDLMLVAVDSMFVAVDESFQHYADKRYDHPRSNWPVYIMLEQKRVRAFRRAFTILQASVDRGYSVTIFERLGGLLAHLKSTNPLGDFEATTVTEGGLPEALLGLVDSLCETLPDESISVEDLWEEDVCNIEDTDILRAIRACPKPQRYRRVGVSAAMSYMFQIISISHRPDGPNRKLDPDEIETEDEGSRGGLRDASKSMGRYAGQRVLIEWKEYNFDWKEKAEDLYALMNNLVNLLDRDVTPLKAIVAKHVLNCVGFFHQPKNFRFGFVYDLESRPQNSLLFSLNSVLRTAKDAAAPNLGDLFELAKDLSRCLLAVHEVGWLHKGLSSHQVLVFSRDLTSVNQDLVSAVLSGFNDSREVTSVTLGPKQDLEYYRHPRYSYGTAFTNVFDYYGLGIVLLEIGSWMCISEIRESHDGIHDSEEFRRTLLRSYVPQLGERMGTRYRDAVAACLDAERLIRSEGNDPTNVAAALNFFKLRVVDLLAGCVA